MRKNSTGSGIPIIEKHQCRTDSPGAVVIQRERDKLPRSVRPVEAAVPLPDTLTDTALEQALFPPVAPSPLKASSPLPDTAYLEKELARPHVTLQRLWEEYC